MAQDLHDGVGHGLAVIAMQAGAALHVLDSDPARARASLEAIRATSKESLDALRAELVEMSGGTVGATAPRRPAPGLDDVAGLVDRVRAAGLRVDVVGSAGTAPTRVGEAVHGVVQEALTNVLRHARASRATVSFDRALDAVLVVTVTDDGQGAAAVGEPGMGLEGMRARVESVGGRLQAGPAEVGFRVRAELPLREDRDS
jgi:signal transduction histidine kinase